MTCKKMTVIVFILSLVILLTGLFIYNKTRAIDYVPTEYENELINYFKEIALNTEYDNNPQRVLKWNSSFILFISKNKKYEEQIKAIEFTINSINELIPKLNIRLTDNPKKCNAVIYLCSKEQIEKLEPDFIKGINEELAGLTQIEWDNRYVIRTAKIFINTDESLDIQTSTILEEITHSLGLLNDSEKYSNSIFYESKSDEDINIYEYSKMDKDLIRFLYHPKMKSGMSAKQSEKVILKILKEKTENKSN